jgi:hypothetical protein
MRGGEFVIGNFLFLGKEEEAEAEAEEDYLRPRKAMALLMAQELVPVTFIRKG